MSDFSSILEAQIQRDKLQAQQNPEFSSQPEEARGFAWILANTHVRKFRSASPRGPSVYFSTRPPAKPHELSPIQIAAARFFEKHEISLSPTFSMRELKTAFRRLARRLHPDGGGSASDFILLKVNFETLATVHRKPR